MRLPQSQKGLSSLGWLSILMIAGFIMLCVSRMAPAYMDDRYIQESLRSLSPEASKIEELSNTAIRGKVSKFFMVNNIRSQSASDVEIDRKGDGVLVMMNYEVRVPIFYNIDVVMTFNNVWDSKRPYDCCKPRSE